MYVPREIIPEYFQDVQNRSCFIYVKDMWVKYDRRKWMVANTTQPTFWPRSLLYYSLVPETNSHFHIYVENRPNAKIWTFKNFQGTIAIWAQVIIVSVVKFRVLAVFWVSKKFQKNLIEAFHQSQNFECKFWVTWILQNSFRRFLLILSTTEVRAHYEPFFDGGSKIV